MASNNLRSSKNLNTEQNLLKFLYIYFARTALGLTFKGHFAEKYLEIIIKGRNEKKDQQHIKKLGK